MRDRQAHRQLSIGPAPAPRQVCLSDEEYTALLDRAPRAQDEERRRISRDLHDHAGAALAAVLLECRLVEASGSVREARERATRLTRLVVATLTELRGLAHGLRPVELDALGFTAALLRLAQTIHGVAVEIDVEAHLALPPPVEEVAFRVVQEALSNVARHAAATHVRVVGRRVGGALEIVIRDDGHGFAPSSIGVNRGVGLRGMRERAVLAGGSLDVVSSPGQGATVFLRVPLP